MQDRRLIWLVGLIAAACARAQTTSTQITLSFTTGLTGSDLDTLSGSGTLTPYGGASISLDLSARTSVITLNDGDTLTGAGTSFTGGVDSGTGTIGITGGTGVFKGAGGSYTFSFLLSSSGSFGLQGSGTVFLPSTTAGPGGSGYPVAGPGGPGYPFSGAGGAMIACDGAGGGGGGAIWRPLNPHPAGTLFGSAASTAPTLTACDGAGGSGGSVLVFDACGSLTWESPFDGSTGSGSSVLTFEGSGGSGSSVLACDGGTGSGGSVLACDGAGSAGGSVFAECDGGLSGGGSVFAECDGAGGAGGSVFACDGGGGAGGSVFASDGAEGAAVLTFDGSGGSGSAIWRRVAPHPATHTLAIAATSTTASTVLNISTPIVAVDATYSATATCPGASGACWISLPATAATGSIAAGSSIYIPVTVTQPSTAAGVYQGQVAITATAGGQSSTGYWPITVVIPSSAPALALSQTGLQFQAAAGTSTALSQFVSVANLTATALPFTAAASTLSGGNWLTVTPSSGEATASAPASVTIQANPSGLAAGQYFGLVNLTAPGAANTPQAVEVVLTVLPASASSSPVLVSPATLQFTATSPGVNPASQTVQLINLSNQTLTVTATPEFQTGTSGGWFTASTSTNSVAAGGTVTATVAISTAGLTAGSYAGSLDLHVAQLNADYSASVLLIVPNSTSAEQGSAASSCTPTQLLPVFTNLESGFQTQAGLPAPVQVQINDDCGNPLESGAASAYFSTGDAPVSLTSLGKGQWTGTWLPHKVAGTTAAVGVLASSFSPALSGSGGVIGTVEANAQTPVINAGGVVSAASVSAGGALPLAPGEFVSIFGSNFAPAGSAPVATPPFPTKLGQVQVMLAGEAMPLQVASSGQINAMVPYDAALNTSLQVMVEANGASYSMPETMVVAAAQPSVFTQNQSGSGPGAILTASATNGTVTLNTAAAPANAGDVLEVYCTGLGAVSPAVPAGSAAPLDTLSHTTNTVTATIGGLPAPVQFAGLAPGYAGLYQVNVTVPPGVAAGSSVPLVLTEAGAASPPVAVAIE